MAGDGLGRTVEPISKKEVGVETILLELKGEGVTGGLSFSDMSLPPPNLSPKLVFLCGTGLRARELEIMVGTLGEGLKVVGFLVVVVVVDVVVVVVATVVVVLAVVVLKLSKGMLIGDLRTGYFVEYFFTGFTVVIFSVLEKLFLSNILLSFSHTENVLVMGGGFS